MGYSLSFLEPFALSYILWIYEIEFSVLEIDSTAVWYLSSIRTYHRNSRINCENINEFIKSFDDL